MGQLQRYDYFLHDQSGAKAGPKTEKQHATAFVAAERLHGGVIEHSNRSSKFRSEIEADPTGAEVFRLRHGLSAANRSRIADGDGVILPIGDDFADSSDHLRRRQRGTAGILARLLRPG